MAINAEQYLPMKIDVRLCGVGNVSNAVFLSNSPETASPANNAELIIINTLMKLKLVERNNLAVPMKPTSQILGIA